MDERNFNHNISRSAKVITGVFIIAIGALLLLHNAGLNLPDWVISWHTFLMALGLYIGVRHQFKSNAWLVLFLIGAYFTIREIQEDFPKVQMIQSVFPVILVLSGLFLIFRPKTGNRQDYRSRRLLRRRNRFGFQPVPDANPENVNASEQFAAGAANPNDYLDSVNVFGGSHHAIYSKNFRGGDIIAIFGGCDVNLSQADFEGIITIEVIAIFGGTKIIVPPGWEVKSEVTAIFGGMDDKRAIQPLNDDQPKRLLIVQGLAMFGGVEIRNY